MGAARPFRQAAEMWCRKDSSARFTGLPHSAAARALRRRRRHAAVSRPAAADRRDHVDPGAGLERRVERRPLPVDVEVDVRPDRRAGLAQAVARSPATTRSAARRSRRPSPRPPRPGAGAPGRAAAASTGGRPRPSLVDDRDLDRRDRRAGSWRSRSSSRPRRRSRTPGRCSSRSRGRATRASRSPSPRGARRRTRPAVGQARVEPLPALPGVRVRQTAAWPSGIVRPWPGSSGIT